MTQQPFRPEPLMGTRAYKTFAIRSPVTTHRRRANCDEAECEAYLNGWQLRVEVLSPELNYTARHSGRRFSEVRVTEGETYLIFEAGQPCFAASTHTVPIDRPAFFLVGRGDYRSFSARNAAQRSPENWVEDMSEHLDTIRTEIERG